MFIKFTKELLRLKRDAKITEKAVFFDLAELKAKISDHLKRIEWHVDGMDKSFLGGGFRNYLDKFICSGDASKRQNALDYYQNRVWWSQEKRLPTIRSSISSVFTLLESFKIPLDEVGSGHRN